MQQAQLLQSCAPLLGSRSSPVAAMGTSTEAWLAGPTCLQQAQQLLTGPARQTHLCSSSSSSSSSG